MLDVRRVLIGGVRVATLTRLAVLSVPAAKQLGKKAKITRIQPSR